MKAGAGAGRVAGTVVARTERRTKNGSKMGIIGLSDPSGHYEAVLFAEGLAQYRDLLEPGTRGAAVPHRRGAGRRGARAHPVGRAARSRRRPRCSKGLRVFLRDEAPIAGVAKRLEPMAPAAAMAAERSGDGEVSVVLMLGNGSEVEVKLPGRFKVSPQIAGAIKAVTGVVTVEAL